MKLTYFGKLGKIPEGRRSWAFLISAHIHRSAANLNERIELGALMTISNELRQELSTLLKNAADLQGQFWDACSAIEDELGFDIDELSTVDKRSVSLGCRSSHCDC